MKKTVVFAFTCGLFVGLAAAAPACRQLEAGLPHEVVLPFPQGLPKTVRVLPLSFAGDVAYETNAVRLCLKDPVRLRVDFGGDAPSQTVFVRPRDTVTPRSTDLYFAPGTHQAGEIVPKAGTRVILARGAVVRGETGDDFIALTALDSPWFERKWARPGRDRAIRDITIRHVKGRTNQCALIRILSHFGQPIYHVTITDVVEDSVPGRHNQTQMAVRIGDRLPAYYANDERNAQRFGDIHDIQVDGLTTRALSAVHTDDGVRNLTVRNVRLFGDARGDGVLLTPCDT